VGPDSAGADPGPACYGRGGELTITDCNLLLGRIVPDQFPFVLDFEAAHQRLSEIAAQSRPPTPSGPEAENAFHFEQKSNHSQHSMMIGPSRSEGTTLEIAAGFVRIANANMA